MLSEQRRVTVGNKPLSNYIALVSTFLSQGVKEVVIRGKGENISKAVDLYNILHRRLGDYLKLTNVSIGTERVGGRAVSYIEITLQRTY
ncbi:MAG: hypothetical protein B7O98_07050 [Zestosphaera tikiterensis]|uniref:DNA/RNA-binding protein Alba n=1 Tax=Zestosphaera tikiterensis TaxID=1973259 RepID=A0A2R7Y4C5_9CREN|nr:MAG: hypothetical protein B7O98_07050 [Zestosphaera tikiterensis]